MLPGPGFHYPPSPYYPFSAPVGYGSTMPWGYPAPPHTPASKIVPPTVNFPQTSLSSGPPQIPVHAEPTSFPATHDLKAWCVQHGLGEAEYDSLLKLRFQVGEGHELTNLEMSMWEWAGIAPLARMQILTACEATVSSGSN